LKSVVASQAGFSVDAAVVFRRTHIAAGIAFLPRGPDTAARAKGEGHAARSPRWAILTIASAFFLAEIGDKTMLAIVALAATESPVGTWLGSTAGMVAADALAIGLGALLGSRLPERAIKLLAAAAFALFGRSHRGRRHLAHDRGRPARPSPSGPQRRNGRR
jgi:putative Ca2+/H+ antiporter (TMEM165/GDT1 family)